MRTFKIGKGKIKKKKLKSSLKEETTVNSYVFYRLPNKLDIMHLSQSVPPLPFTSCNDIPPNSGFVFHPFIAGKDSPAYFIRAEQYFRLSPEEVSKMANKFGKFPVSKKSEDANSRAIAGNNYEIRKGIFCKQVEKAVSIIKKGTLEKVVLSQVSAIKTEEKHNPVSYFLKLCKKYSSAFVYLVCIPDGGIWLGASPEMLLSFEKNKIQTVSLAGTKSQITSWKTKEKKEQQLVTDYIHSILKAHARDITVSEPKEVNAGNLSHLQTTFTAILNSSFWELVNELHPTPAVGGVPRDKALKFIAETEQHERKFYTGFLGPVNFAGKTDLFVNIRCAELFRESADIYAGAGITKDSVPEKEWEETEMKANTMGSILASKVEV
jgi:isochorismate synthase